MRKMWGIDEFPDVLYGIVIHFDVRWNSGQIRNGLLTVSSGTCIFILGTRNAEGNAFDKPLIYKMRRFNQYSCGKSYCPEKRWIQWINIWLCHCKRIWIWGIQNVKVSSIVMILEVSSHDILMVLVLAKCKEASADTVNLSIRFP